MSARLGRVLRSPALRLVIGVAVVGVVVLRVGTAPFLHALRSLDLGVVLLAVLLAVVATAAMAWRWRTIARELGLDLPWRVAFGRYFRSQFLNAVLPGGVLGDVHRAVEHGHEAGTGPAVRAVVVERTVGQVVQAVLTVVVLLGLGIAFLPRVAGVLAAGAVLLGIAVAAATAVPRVRAVVRRETSAALVAVRRPVIGLEVVLASCLSLACHVATFALAAAAVGAALSPARVVVVALVVLVAAAVPFSVGGWGPREGAAGWAFALAGAGAANGVAAAALFGVLAVVAVAPGALVAEVLGRARARAGSRSRSRRRPSGGPVFTTLSCAVSLDGCLDDAGPERLVLSNAEDLDRVDGVRAGHDAILVGAETVRRDDPRLLVRSAARRAERVRAGRGASPWKATLTRSGDLDPDAAFFTAGDPGDPPRLVYCPDDVAPRLRERVGDAATVIGVDAGVRDVSLHRLVDDLAARGVRRLLVEGGAATARQFLDAGLVDELHLVVAPMLVDDPRAPRFPALPSHARLLGIREIGEVVLLRYGFSGRVPALPAAIAPRAGVLA